MPWEQPLGCLSVRRAKRRTGARLSASPSSESGSGHKAQERHQGPMRSRQSAVVGMTSEALYQKHGRPGPEASAVGPVEQRSDARGGLTSRMPCESGTLARWEVNLTQQWATLYRSGIAWSHILEGSLCSTRGPRSRCTAIGARLPEASGELRAGCSHQSEDTGCARTRRVVRKVRRSDP